MGKIIGFACLFVAGLLYYGAYRLKNKLDEYEFNNRTQGGVIEFNNFKASKSHELKKKLVTLLIILMLPFMFIGGLLVLLGK